MASKVLARSDEAQQSPPVRQKGRPRHALLRVLPLYLSIAPFYILFAIFGLFPLAFSLYLAFQKWDGIGPMKFVGLNQFAYLITDDYFWQAVGNTLTIWLLSTIPMLVLALLLAFLFSLPQLRLRQFYQVAYFLPNVTSVVAIAIISGSVFGNNFGLLNALLTALGVHRFAWLNDPWGIKIAIASIVVWRWTGYNAIIYLAGLQSIPSGLYEAARIDGAATPQLFFHITVPLMRPVILFTLITSTIGGLHLFAEAQVLLGDSGGPGGAGMTVVQYLYQQAFIMHRFGYGAAIGWSLFLLILLFSVLNVALSSLQNPLRIAR